MYVMISFDASTSAWRLWPQNDLAIIGTQGGLIAASETIDHWTFLHLQYMMRFVLLCLSYDIL